MKLIEILLLTFPMLFELVTDYIDILRGKKDKKTEDVWIRLTFALICGTINNEFVTGVSVWQHILFYLAIHFALFDYLLNILRMFHPWKEFTWERLFHLGNNPWDRIKKYFGVWWSRLIIEGVLLLTGYGIYTNLDMIL